MTVKHITSARYRVALILKGNIDASIEANLPTTKSGGDTYKVTVAGDFGGSALISPAGSYFDVTNMIVWNAIAGTWDKIDTTENISDTAYNDTSWDGVTRDAPSKNAVRDQLVVEHTATGQNADGTYTAPVVSNYLSTATSLKSADSLLDTKVKAVQDEVDLVETGSGLNTDGTYTAPTDTNYTRTATSLKNADALLDSGIGSIHPNGLEDATKFTISYTGRQFTLTVASGAYYWSSGIRYFPTAGATVTDAHTNATDNYWLVYRAGALTVTTSPDFLTDCLLAYAYYNANAGSGILFDERHPDTWDPSVHRYEHIHSGAKLVSGGTIADYVVDTNGDDNTTFSIPETIIDDESLRHTLTALADNGPYTVWYRNGADANDEWYWSNTPVVPFLHDTDDPYYNRLNAGTWDLFPISSNSQWVNYYLFATNAYNDSGNNYKHRYILVMGEQIHTTLASAQDASVITAIDWGEKIPFLEFVPLYKIIYKRVSDPTYKNVQIDEVSRIVGTNTSLSLLASPTIHNALSGRSDAGAHPSTAISTTFSGTNYLDTKLNVNSALTELDIKIKSEAIKYAIVFGG